VRRHRLHIVAAASAKPSRGALMAQLAGGETNPIVPDDTFDLKSASAVGNRNRCVAITQRQQERFGLVRCQVEMRHRRCGRMITRRFSGNRDGHARPVDGRYLGDDAEHKGAVPIAANFDRPCPPLCRQWWRRRGWWQRKRPRLNRTARKSRFRHTQWTGFASRKIRYRRAGRRARNGLESHSHASRRTPPVIPAQAGTQDITPLPNTMYRPPHKPPQTTNVANTPSHPSPAEL